MLAVFIEASFRSLALAMLVWACLRVLRIRNVVSLRCAWTAVLIGSLLMPFALQFTAHWRVFSIAALPSLAALDRLQSEIAPAEPPPPPAAPAREHGFATVRHDRYTAPGSAIADQGPFGSPSSPVDRAPALSHAASQIPAAPARISVASIAVLAYLLVAAAMLLRLFFGLASALRLWNASTPVEPHIAARSGADFNLRFNRNVITPVTIGSGVVLPADYTGWTQEKLRIVLAHEGSHVRQHDFHVQTLASLYTALAWFSPLGWWLKRKLSDLAEAISDRSGLEEAASRSSYAQVLLEFAAAPRTTLIGVAMARSSNLSHRIERLFNDRAFRQAFAASRRTLVAALFVPIVMFAAATLVRINAATLPPQEAAPAPSQGAAGQSNPDAAPPAAAPAQAAPAAEPAPAAAPTPAPNAAPATPGTVEVPPIHVKVPAIHVDVPAQHIDVPAVHVDVPAQHIDVPAVHVNVPAQHIDVPAVHVEMPEQNIDIPGRHIDVPPTHVEVPPIHIVVPAGEKDEDGHASNGTTAGLYAMLTGFGHTLFARHANYAAVENGAAETEAAFDRNLSFSGKLELSVGTGSGNITLKQGPAGQLRIHGIVKGNQKADPAQVQQIAANPPIQQEGNEVHIGGHSENQHMQNISIDYEIEAPADTAVNAATGSGNIDDTGVGQDAKLITGSGNIQATGIAGGFKVQTGSGNIDIDGTGEGEAKAETGSGNIELKGVQGALTAQTGSGDIKAAGTPSSAWRLQAGSGSIELATGNARMNLDASTGSGEIATSSPITFENPADHHHVHAQLNGGGPEVKIETGSGDIHIN